MGLGLKRFRRCDSVTQNDIEIDRFGLEAVIGRSSSSAGSAGQSGRSR